MILITGGGGLLGLNLARDLIDKGQEVLLLQRHEVELPPFLVPYRDKQVKGAVGEILEWPFLCHLMATYPIDSIVHAAAVWPGRSGTTSLYQVVSVNVGATVNILEAARIFKLRRVTFISSTTVYLGLDDKVQSHEGMNLPTISPEAISATKKASEQICGLYGSTHGLSVPIVRVARIYGPTAHWRRNPLERMVVGAVEGKRVDLPDTYEGSLISPIFAKDCAKGISLIHLATNLKHDIYNLADGNLVTYGTLANLVKEIIPGAEIHLGTDKQLARSHPPVSTERLKAEGWAPEYSDLKKGIGSYVDYLRTGKY